MRSGTGYVGMRGLAIWWRGAISRSDCVERELAKARLQVVGAEIAEGVGGCFLETREAAAGDKFYVFCGAVALLGNAEFGFLAFFGSGAGFEEVGAVDEHDDVGVLLDGAGFAEVRELGAALVALRRASELAEDE